MPMRDRWDLLVVFCFDFFPICFFRFFLFFFGMHLLDTPLAYSWQGVHVHSHRVFSDYCASGCHETCDDLTLFLRLTGLYLMYIRISLIVTLLCSLSHLGTLDVHGFDGPSTPLQHT